MKIESGFGEKLTHLDEAYKGMRESFDQLPGRLDIKDAKKELKQEEQELRKILKERDELINELADKAQLREEEREKFIQTLGSQESALHEARQEINFLKGQLRRSGASKDRISREIPPMMIEYIQRRVIPGMDPKFIINESSTFIRKKFRRMIEEFDNAFIKDLGNYRFLDDRGELTPQGVALFKEQAGKILEEKGGKVLQEE